MSGGRPNKCAVIVGASGGIGKAIGLALAEGGYDLLLHYGQNEEAVDDIARAARAVGRHAVSYKGDVRSLDDAKRLAAVALSEWSGVSVLVNTAGVTLDRPLVTMTPDDWHQVVNTNLNGVFNMCRSFIYPMIRQRSGKIINVSSAAGSIGVAGQTNYCASKAGMEGFTRALAVEVARFSITVNCVAPGYIDTSMIAALTPQQRGAALARIPMGRFGTPQDVAGLCCFLASSAGDYVTGQTYVIDGGLTV